MVESLSSYGHVICSWLLFFAQDKFMELEAKIEWEGKQ